MTHCPVHGHGKGQGDSSPSLSFTTKDDGKELFDCKVGCTKEEIVAVLKDKGFWKADAAPRPERRREEKSEAKKRDWMATNARSLEYVATKVRIDEPGKSKKMFWKPKLSSLGIGVTDLSLYLHENARIRRNEAVVVITEGESCADALAALEMDLGIVVVGTVTGSSTIPCDASLDFLAGRTVLLWPDNDAPGYQHMTKIATRLHDLGAKKIGMIDWPDAPTDGGDAVDAIKAGVDIGELIAKALTQDWQPEQFDLADLLDRTFAAIRRFVILNHQQLAALTLWIASTHAFSASQLTPYISVTSAERGSGKSRLLEVLVRLVANPFNSSHVTASVLVRRIARDRPTVLLDEIDALFKGNKEKAEHIRGILNAGYARGGTYSMSEPVGNSWEPVDYDVFSPKIFAGIGNRLPDTVQDRSIPIEMRRRAPNEQCERFSFRKSPAFLTPIHDELDVWASGAIPVLMDAEPDLPKELSDRAADVWEPLLAIADLAGGDWPDRARAAARILSAGEHGNRLSLGVMALRDIKFVFESKGTDVLATADLVKELLAMDESPWGDMWGGKELDNRSLARILTAYDIKPKSVRISSDSTLKGYRKEWFVDAWSRYLQTDGTTVTTVTDIVLEPSNVPDVPLVPVKAGSGAEEEQEWNLQH